MTPQLTERKKQVSAACVGDPPLRAHLQPWMSELASNHPRLRELLDTFGSPLNLHQTSSFEANADEISRAAAAHGLEIGIYFARKANKSLGFVDEARRLGLGVDVASEQELAQTLKAGLEPDRIILTAAVKPPPLLRLAAEAGVTISIDNEQELSVLAEITAGRRGEPLPVALRLTPGCLSPERIPSRFGLPQGRAREVAREVGADQMPGLRIAGVHFHLDGYSADDRIATLGEAVELIDGLREDGHEPGFVDIGGGFPISYLTERNEWDEFWRAHRAALLGERPSLTFEGHGLGLAAHDGKLRGAPAVYPFWQEPTRGEWLQGILSGQASVGGRPESVAEALRTRGLELRCEPGRALLDGCGMTAASVEFVKPYERGTHLVGLEMNRTQCRTGSDDFLVDPLLVRAPASREARAALPPAGFEGYLVGAYCIERELLSWRRLHFPYGVARGDVVLFPNTAGYFMHIQESSSHQMPLARNLLLTPPPGLHEKGDRIDSIPER